MVRLGRVSGPGALRGSHGRARGLGRVGAIGTPRRAHPRLLMVQLGRNGTTTALRPPHRTAIPLALPNISRTRALRPIQPLPLLVHLGRSTNTTPPPPPHHTTIQLARSRALRPIQPLPLL